MAEDDAAADQEQQQQPPQVQMRVLAQFIRDMSFENVMAQKGASGQIEPDINVQVSVDARRRQVEHQYDVTLKLNITNKAKGMDDILFLMELDYYGIFHVEGIPSEQLQPFLLIECPRLLFPYVRRIVSDVTSDGGFPPLNLDQIDFVQIYRQRLAHVQAQAQAQQKDQKADA
ncbi:MULTISPECIES: protein-export chaperone SecB [Ruegeria]|uniref:protein-export chaperone SecB n=1 Tax=Ruegeria TaxID=97050 RepID=UPI002742785A|nr:protein-export chaperone SecB [Ruegeria sp. 2205SS24-7]MDP5219469.1 protein-export chaperone SecB [Ruegeria sp. 2205SS24-7]